MISALTQLTTVQQKLVFKHLRKKMLKLSAVELET